jgi:hypothetical protein
MTRPGTRLLAVSIIVILILGGTGLYAVKRSRLALPGQEQQGGIFYGFRDVELGLSGTPVTAPITDWSFLNEASTCQIQVFPWWRIPYTVRVYAPVMLDGKLYLLSDYKAPLPGNHDLRDEFPNARGWNKHLVRDPRIRIKVGDRIITGVAEHVPEPPGPAPELSLDGRTEYERVRRIFYDKVAAIRRDQAMPPDQRNKMHYFRITPQWGA